MADENRASTAQNTERVAQWLTENRAEFEGQGISEDELAPALGMTSTEIIEAIDHLEAREEVVRIPHALTTPTQFTLKPGRGWIDARDKILGSGNDT
jgi:DNA-binding GntR family transcriptional regulator